MLTVEKHKGAISSPKEAVHTCMPIIVREPQLGRVMDNCVGCSFFPKMRFSKSKYNKPVKNINRPPQVLQMQSAKVDKLARRSGIYVHCVDLFDLICR